MQPYRKVLSPWVQNLNLNASKCQGQYFNSLHSIKNMPSVLVPSSNAATKHSTEITLSKEGFALIDSSRRGSLTRQGRHGIWTRRQLITLCLQSGG